MNTTIESTAVYQNVNHWQGKPVSTRGIPEPQEVWKWLGQGTVILWTHAGIAVGKLNERLSSQSEGDPNDALSIVWRQGEDLGQLDWKTHLVELRAFNEHREWRILENGKGRKRVDLPGDENDQEAVESQMALRGIVADCLQVGNETLALNTRHYLGVNEIGMTTYVDVRFVEIKPTQKGGTQ